MLKIPPKVHVSKQDKFFRPRGAFLFLRGLLELFVNVDCFFLEFMKTICWNNFQFVECEKRSETLPVYKINYFSLPIIFELLRNINKKYPLKHSLHEILQNYRAIWGYTRYGRQSIDLSPKVISARKRSSFHLIK